MNRHTTYRLPDVPEGLVGSIWLVDGWRIRLDKGRKAPGDVRIWVATPGGEECLMSLAAMGAIISLWYRNEDRLYPHGSGGRYVLAFLEACCQDGIESACRLYKLKPRTIERVHETAHGAPTDEPPPVAPFDADMDAATQPLLRDGSAP